MRIQHAHHDQRIILTLTGHLNARAVPDVRRALFTALAARPAAVICDLDGVRSLDPAGASVFASATHPASGWPATKLLLCGARPAVTAILAERAISQLLPVYATLDQALQQTLDAHDGAPLRLASACKGTSPGEGGLGRGSILDAGQSPVASPPSKTSPLVESGSCACVVHKR
jgi:anti-anti-sigma factor